MQLLLLLSALLASLTEAAAGVRAQEPRPVEASSAIVEAAVEGLAAIREDVRTSEPAASSVWRADAPAVSNTVMPARIGEGYERLLE